MAELSVRERRIWTLGIVGAACFVAVVAWQAISNERERAAVRAYVARLRAAGEPTTFRELYGPEPPDDVNSAPEITAALKWLDDSSERPWMLTVTGPWDPAFFDDGGPWYERATPERLTELNAFFVRIRPFFDGVASAIDRPRCRFPLSVDDNGWSIDDGIRSIQALSRILGARATVDPDPAARIEACRTLCVLSRRYEPLDGNGLGCAVSAWSAQGTALTALRHGAETGAIDAASARAWLDPLLAKSWLDVAPRLFGDQIVAYLSLFDAAVAGRTTARRESFFTPDDALGFRRAPLTAVKDCEMSREASRWPIRPLAACIRKARTTAKAHADDADNGAVSVADTWPNSP